MGLYGLLTPMASPACGLNRHLLSHTEMVLLWGQLQSAELGGQSLGPPLPPAAFCPRKVFDPSKPSNLHPGNRS